MVISNLGKKNATSFTPFQLVYGVESTLLIECEIPSLKLYMYLLLDTTPHEEQLLYLKKLDETLWDATIGNEVHKKSVKAQFDKSIFPNIFLKDIESWFMTKTNISWGQLSFCLCGKVLTL